MQRTLYVSALFIAVLYGNNNYATCTHAVYSETSNQAFCDFWYKTNQENTLQLCDCKLDNDKYCTSWICVIISNYDFNNKTKSEEMLHKILLPNDIDIYGVDECGYFTVDNNNTIPQYCYKYNDWQSCYCLSNDDNNYCENWICHKYSNIGNFSLDDDISNHENDTSSIDILEYATPVSNEEYDCTQSYNSDTDIINKDACIKWKGTLVKYDGLFSSMNCGVESWNSDVESIGLLYGSNFTVNMNDLVDAYVYKWQCNESEINVNEFCQLCKNGNISELICDSITDVCGDWVVEISHSNTLMIIIGSICGVIGCSCCIVVLICLRKKCMKGRYGYVEGYELSAV